MPAPAQEPADTAKVNELEEITVQAREARAAAGSTTFIPTSRQRQTSQDAYDLLRRLGMPQIIVRGEDNVKNISGQAVSLYIDRLPATKEELANLNTADVLRVEYLEHPSDVCYQGNAFVINYTLRRYLWGGYTRLNAHGQCMNSACFGGGVFSKFTYKRMTYDLYAGYDYTNAHHGGVDQTETFKLTPSGGAVQLVDRHIQADYFRSRSHALPLTLRAAYRHSNFSTYHKLGFRYGLTPHSTDAGHLTLDNGAGQDYTYRTRMAEKEKTLSYTGHAQLRLGRGFQLASTPLFSYTRRSRDDIYATHGAQDGLIDRGNQEQSVFAGLEADVVKSFNQSLYLLVGFQQNYTYSKVRYTGNIPSIARLSNITSRPFAQISYSTPRLQLVFHTSVMWTHNKINGKAFREVNPSAYLSAGYSPNSRHQLQLTASLYSDDLGMSFLTDGILQSNELLYITGNPNVKKSYMFNGNFSYTWLPSNKLFATAYLNFQCAFDPVYFAYRPYLDGNAVIRTWDKNGYLHGIEPGLSVTYKPIGALQLTGGVSCLSYKRRGIIRMGSSPVTWRLGADYYLSNFYFSGSFNSRSTQPDLLRLVTAEVPCEYSVAAGWRRGAWNLRITAANLFRSSWTASRSTLSSEYYSYRSTDYGTAMHRSLTSPSPTPSTTASTWTRATRWRPSTATPQPSSNDPCTGAYNTSTDFSNYYSIHT